MARASKKAAAPKGGNVENLNDKRDTKKGARSNPTNGAEDQIEFLRPYHVEVTIKGIADLLFHRWNVESVDEKAAAAKGSKAKKTDNVESYVYRNNTNELCLPGEYLRMSIVNTARYFQDPRSPRKSLMDLMKAGLVPLTPLASLGVEDWDYLDRRRCMVQRQGINRTRPAMHTGWKATFQFMMNLPEYIPAPLLQEIVNRAGLVTGVADFRPTFGRFVVDKWEVLELGEQDGVEVHKQAA